MPVGGCAWIRASVPVAQVGDTFVLNCLGEGSYGPIMKVRLAHNISALADKIMCSSCISLHVDRRCMGPCGVATSKLVFLIL